MAELRCQSCGMPLGEFKTPEGLIVRNFGTQADGLETSEYCTFCYREGTFTEPHLTLTDMINRSVEHMTSELRMPISQAQALAVDTIPTLKRWRQGVL